MSAVALENERERPLSAEELFEFWLRRSNEFMAWQERNFILREATTYELAEHSQRLDLMLGLTLHVYSMASHSMPEKLSAIRGRLWQLEDSLELVHNPISDEEAGAILNQVFPDEPGTPGTA
jgi:hypothetical protein